MRRVLAALSILLAILASPALAIQPGERLDDPAMEARARSLSAELRCMVCQNQSIDDSDAQLAKDLRLLVRERLVAGDTNDQVLDFLVDRYGEFVLLKPRFESHTLVLWLSAPAMLLLGLIVAFVAYRRRALRPVADSHLSTEERQALDRLLSDEPGTPR